MRDAVFGSLLDLSYIWVNIHQHLDFAPKTIHNTRMYAPGQGIEDGFQVDQAIEDGAEQGEAILSLSLPTTLQMQQMKSYQRHEIYRKYASLGQFYCIEGTPSSTRFYG